MTDHINESKLGGIDPNALLDSAMQDGAFGVLLDPLSADQLFALYRITRDKLTSLCETEESATGLSKVVRDFKTVFDMTPGIDKIDLLHNLCDEIRRTLAIKGFITRRRRVSFSGIIG